jgi:hypothetical protein
LLPSVRVQSYPNRAGHCLGGAQIGEASGGVHGRQGSGSLDDGGFTVMFGDVVLENGVVPELAAGETYSVALQASGGTPFRGFLLRVSGLHGEEMQESLTVTDNSTQLLLSTGEQDGFESSCAVTVAGLCHNSRVDKSGITTEFMHESEADVLIEVTVVTNNEGGGKNDWYFSDYRTSVRQAAASQAPETLAPQTTFPLEGTPSPVSQPILAPSATRCKWYCPILPIPWVSQDPTEYPKCDWTFSCSRCPECTDTTRRRRHLRNSLQWMGYEPFPSL